MEGGEGRGTGTGRGWRTYGVILAAVDENELLGGVRKVGDLRETKSKYIEKEEKEIREKREAVLRPDSQIVLEKEKTVRKAETRRKHGKDED